VTAMYGKKFNGYMGIGTAYPVDQYETLKVDICRLSDKRKGGWPRPPKEDEEQANSISGRVNSLVAAIIHKARSLTGTLPKFNSDPWNYSEYRFNQFIAIQVKEKNGTGAPFWVGNYHMPCAFRDPPVMNIHAELVAKRIQTLANSDAYVLAGDFNLTPDSCHYGLLTKGILDKEDPTYPKPKYDVEWESTISCMRSAYAVYNNGVEPDFTNHAYTGEGEYVNEFVATIDYLFLSEEWKVTGVKELSSFEDANGPYPNAVEPSDHVLIAANLEF
jgi:2',5'-phosphodiesterase